MLCAGVFAAASANAQSSQNSGFGVGPIHEGLVVGAIAGIAAVAAVGITFLVLHNRGVVVGCIAESGGKRTLVTSDKSVYALSDGGAEVLKDYGHCQP